MADFRATSLATLVQMVASGAGITLLPQLAAGALSGRGLSLVPFAKPVPSRTIGLAFRRTSPRRAEFQALAAAFHAGAGKDGI